MINAKSEFLKETKGKANVLCAILHYGGRDFILKNNHTNIELENFLSNINFEYDDGYGTQHLFGYIWYSNNTWSERYEYDGAEYWDFKEVPKIPKECFD
jgi:hypothetical protein